jgi:hypothetical protein
MDSVREDAVDWAAVATPQTAAAHISGTTSLTEINILGCCIFILLIDRVGNSMYLLCKLLVTTSVKMLQKKPGDQRISFTRLGKIGIDEERVPHSIP